MHDDTISMAGMTAELPAPDTDGPARDQGGTGQTPASGVAGPGFASDAPSGDASSFPAATPNAGAVPSAPDAAPEPVRFAIECGQLARIAQTFGFAPNTAWVRVDVAGPRMQFTLTTGVILSVITLPRTGQGAHNAGLSFGLSLERFRHLTRPLASSILGPRRGASSCPPYRFAVTPGSLGCTITIGSTRLKITLEPPPPRPSGWSEPVMATGRPLDPRVLRQALRRVAPAAASERKKPDLGQVAVRDGRAVATDQQIYAQFRASELDGHAMAVARAGVPGLGGLLARLDPARAHIRRTEQHIVFDDDQFTIGVRHPTHAMPAVPDLEDLPMTLACRCDADELDRWLNLATCLGADRTLQVELALFEAQGQPMMRVSAEWGKNRFITAVSVDLLSPDAHVLAARLARRTNLAGAGAPATAPPADPETSATTIAVPGDPPSSGVGVRAAVPELPLGFFPLTALLRVMSGTAKSHVDLLWSEGKGIALKETGETYTAVTVLAGQARNHQHGVRAVRRR